MITEVIVSVLLILVVVLQESKAGGMGSAFGGGDTIFGGKVRGKDAVLSRLTIILGTIFALVTLALGKYLNTF